MLYKIITSLFLMYYMYHMFSQHASVRQFHDTYKNNDIKKLADIGFSGFDRKLYEDLIEYTLNGLFIMFVCLSEFVYAIISLSIAPFMSLMYLAFLTTVLAVGLTKKKRANNGGSVKTVSWKFRIMLLYFVDVCYFMYMLSVLFNK